MLNFLQSRYSVLRTPSPTQPPSLEDDSDDLDGRHALQLQTRIKNLFHGASVGVLFLNIVLLVVLIRQTYLLEPQSNRWLPRANGGAQTLAIESEIRRFGSDARYMSLDHQYDPLWTVDLEPRVAIVDLPVLDGSARDLAAIGMIHQMHCLASMRKGLQEATEGKYIGDDIHWPHCMDYLRQAILCHADITLERRAVTANGTLARHISGVQDLRQCGNADEIYAFRDKYPLARRPSSYTK